MSINSTYIENNKHIIVHTKIHILSEKVEVMKISN